MDTTTCCAFQSFAASVLLWGCHSSPLSKVFFIEALLSGDSDCLVEGLSTQPALWYPKLCAAQNLTNHALFIYSFACLFLWSSSRWTCLILFGRVGFRTEGVNSWRRQISSFNDDWKCVPCQSHLRETQQGDKSQLWCDSMIRWNSS